ncbi:unnamed protein product [Nesidiocoris tenuis]|uniref:Uncharacterized protein n=1 Tax=Nesidiocoris tenuis TaxID=355587 RepID=A0A6H5GKN4_9HEMI|nr:unnamed protein product [Nesidiocoris tenuis]
MIYRISSVRLNRYLTLNYSHNSVRGCIAETSALVPIKEGVQNEHWVPEMKDCAKKSNGAQQRFTRLRKYLPTAGSENCAERHRNPTSLRKYNIVLVKPPQIRTNVKKKKSQSINSKIVRRNFEKKTSGSRIVLRTIAKNKRRLGGTRPYAPNISGYLHISTFGTSFPEIMYLRNRFAWVPNSIAIQGWPPHWYHDYAGDGALQPHFSDRDNRQCILNIVSVCPTMDSSPSKKKLVACGFLLHVFMQLFLPYSHFITKKLWWIETGNKKVEGIPSQVIFPSLGNITVVSVIEKCPDLRLPEGMTKLSHIDVYIVLTVRFRPIWFYAWHQRKHDRHRSWRFRIEGPQRTLQGTDPCVRVSLRTNQTDRRRSGCARHFLDSVRRRCRQDGQSNEHEIKEKDEVAMANQRRILSDRPHVVLMNFGARLPEVVDAPYCRTS